MALKTTSISLAILARWLHRTVRRSNLSTTEPLKVDPLKVDLNMRVDVYQHADAERAEAGRDHATGRDRGCADAVCAIAWEKSRC